MLWHVLRLACPTPSPHCPSHPLAGLPDMPSAWLPWQSSKQHHLWPSHRPILLTPQPTSIWNVCIPMMYDASLVKDCRPLPPTPTHSMCAPGCLSTRAMRDTCSTAYLQQQQQQQQRWQRHAMGLMRNSLNGRQAHASACMSVFVAYLLKMRLLQCGHRWSGRHTEGHRWSSMVRKTHCVRFFYAIEGHRWSGRHTVYAFFTPSRAIDGQEDTLCTLFCVACRANLQHVPEGPFPCPRLVRKGMLQVWQSGTHHRL